MKFYVCNTTFIDIIAAISFFHRVSSTQQRSLSFLIRFALETLMERWIYDIDEIQHKYFKTKINEIEIEKTHFLNQKSSFYYLLDLLPPVPYN